MSDGPSELNTALEALGLSGPSTCEPLGAGLLSALRQGAEAQIPNVPAFPRSAVEILRLASMSEVDLDELVRAVGNDAAVSLELVRVANSAASAARQPIRSVRDAAVRLGARTSAAVAGASATRTLHRGREKAASERDRLLWDWLWVHSSSTAFASLELASDVRCRQPGLAFLVGLFHDLGALPCLRALCEEPLASELRGLSLANVLCALEALHLEMGELLATRLELPAEIAEGIRDHQSPGRVQREIHVVRAVSAMSQLAHASASRASTLDELGESLERLGLTPRALSMIARSLADAEKRLVGG